MKNSDDKMLVPSYYKNFACIGGACEDSCCIGWTIEVDEETYKKYKKVKHPSIKQRLDKELVARRAHTTANFAAKIKLKNGRCAFLSNEGWCDLYSALGKQYLSDTCTFYPRTVNSINGDLEGSLVCSCPEAARQILLSKNKITFDKEEKLERSPIIYAQITVNNDNPKKWQDYFFSLRTLVINLLQNENGTLEEKFNVLEYLMKDIEKTVALLTGNKIPELIKKYQKISKKEFKAVKASQNFTQKALNYVEKLKALKETKKIKSSRYGNCLQETLLGLDKLQKEQLEEGLGKAREIEHMLENYFVNYVFERCIPIDQKSPMQSFNRMQLYYYLLKLHLMGLYSYHGDLTKEQVVWLIQSFSKIFDHDDETLMQLAKEL